MATVCSNMMTYILITRENRPTSLLLVLFRKVTYSCSLSLFSAKKVAELLSFGDDDEAYSGFAGRTGDCKVEGSCGR